MKPGEHPEYKFPGGTVVGLVAPVEAAVKPAAEAEAAEKKPTAKRTKKD